ncbi:MAG: hypothetical protein COT85_02315 [Chlamydiae bacterium CG10_big_fil_rev_8_21_14_0_10_42_34]|nr:MAG: hypothetical protein COT85_02315 [Chlamydiae bacterium CG10_big_fil_rev_8_21_14_0_10_42_34]
MAHQISRREVLNNLVRFKDNISEMRGQRERNQDQDQQESEQEGKFQSRTYKVLINRKTGDMRFARRIKALEQHISQKEGNADKAEDWKEVRIVVHEKSKKDPVQFEVKDAHNESLNTKDLEPLAWRIAGETMDVLNQRAKEVLGKMHNRLAEEAVLEDLSTIYVIESKERIDDLPGWMGSLSRIDAEEILDGKPLGTYLLREGDEITVSIAFHFSEENLLAIHPYLLTVVEADEKISDVLLLQTNKGWTLYQDDPNLQDGMLYEYFSSPQGLLQKISGTAKYPLS